MGIYYRACFFLLFLFMVLAGQAGDALAQVSNQVLVEASGTTGTIRVTVDLDIGGTLDPQWVGWVIDRGTIGICDQPVVQIGDPTPFPTGAQSYLLADDSAVPGVTYKYRIYAVDAAGTRHILPGPDEFPPAYYHFDYASIGNNGYVAEGNLVDLGWTTGIEVCLDGCWEYISFISNPPAEFVDLAGTGTMVRIFGRIDAEFEGSYIPEVTSWNITSGCSPVANEEKSWGGLKAMYR